jgi:hypothetical protein
MTRFGRRQLLRGLLSGTAVSVALPTLDAMLGSTGEALANGEPLPKRFGIFFWGDGVRLAKWNPTATGANFPLSESLMPLSPVRPYVSVVSGTSIKAENRRGHHAGAVGILSGAPFIPQDPKGAPYASTFSQPSIDQVVARHVGKTTKFRSLEIGISTRVVTGEGTTLRYLSHNGPDDANPPEFEPKKLFERVFGVGFDDPATSAKMATKVGLRRSVLDAVRLEANALKAKVGAADRTRIDQHLEGIRTLETRLATMSSAPVCSKPTAPGLFPANNGQEPLEERTKAFADLLAIAMACDLTRVFSIQFTGSVAQTVFWMTGTGNNHHALSHDEPGDQPLIQASTVFTMKCFGHLLERLAATKEGAGNLLDRSAIMATSDTAHGREHTTDDYPIVIAGTAGGALKGGVHYRSTTRENSSHVLFSLAKAMDLKPTEFGKDGGRVTTGLSAIEGG